MNPLTTPGWNELLLKSGQGGIFHSANWARLIHDSYGYHPAYFTLSDEGAFQGCQPVMEVDSLLTGRRGVCLSFADYCGSLVRSADQFRPLFEGILELGRMSGWRYAEFRGEQFLEREVPAKVYAHHVLELSADERVMHSRLRDSTARNIRKAQKEGVTVRSCRTLEGVRDFYRLHCLTRKRLGVPPQPFRFFEKLHEHVIAPGLGFTSLASHGGTTVAGLVCLHFGADAVYKFGASDLKYQQLRANNLVFWETIKRCAAEGFRSFSFGRTDLDNEGLLSFKDGWGGSRSELRYYRYDFAKSGFVGGSKRDLELYRSFLKRLPVTLLRALGTLAYRHLG